MRRTLYIAGVLTVLAAGLGVRYGGKAIAEATLTPTPFTATIREGRHAANGDLLYEETMTHAVRSDGSIVETVWRPSPDGRSYERRSVTDLPGKCRVQIDAATESKTTYPLSDEGVKQLMLQTGDCSKRALDAGEAVLGFDTVRQTEGLGDLHVERLLAPKLGCLVVREYARSSRSGAFIRRELTSAVTGEPDAGLFAVPAYTERRPSEVFAESARRFPGRHQPPAQTTDRLDAVYAAHQQKK